MTGATAKRLRWSLWLALLAGTSWLLVFGEAASESQALPVRSSAVAAQEPAPAPSAPAADTARLAENQQPLQAIVDRQRQWSRDPSSDAAAARDLFSARDWRPPAPAASAAASESVSPPPAPPLPFTYLGGKFEGGAWEIFLARGEHTFVVKEGQVIEGVYRIDKIAPPSMGFTHLPSGEAQHLAIGGGR